MVQPGTGGVHGNVGKTIPIFRVKVYDRVERMDNEVRRQIGLILLLLGGGVGFYLARFFF